MENKKIMLTGIKPTGELTLGNYIGVLKNLKDFQEEYESFIFIADLHALTLPIDPNELNKNSKDIAAFYLAAGLDPDKSHIFLQSSVSAHSELNTIMMNYLYMGELSRMTQFKEKSANMNNSAIGLGIFSYPVLMACDIILYDADIVPVGEDQAQHVELTRDLVRRFNSRYKTDVLKEPKTVINQNRKRIKSLSDPSKKMSKSDPKGVILLLDDEKTIRKKIMSAVTDLGCEVKYDEENKPGISNLLTIYCAMKDISIQEAEKEFEGCNYGTFKKAVADAVVNDLMALQNKYNEIINSNKVNEALIKGRDAASPIANKKLHQIQKIVGLYGIKE